MYTVAAARAVSPKGQPADRLYTTPPLAFGLLPVVDTTGPIQLVFTAVDATMAVKMLTPIRKSGATPTQKVRLFAGSVELLGESKAVGATISLRTIEPDRLRKDLDAAKARGEILYLRVQVDGVDSSLVKPPVDGTPTRQFDEKLIIQDTP